MQTETQIQEKIAQLNVYIDMIDSMNAPVAIIHEKRMIIKALLDVLEE
jgi:prefoldin subunit 5